uniref:hypothetical protein n=1 Tax=Escherichia coli TaxID=562 RepID=UPI00196467B3
ALKLSPLETFNIDRPVFVANRGEFLIQDTLHTTTGTQLNRCFRNKRWSHKTLPIVGLRLVFANSRLISTGEDQSGLTDILV